MIRNGIKSEEVEKCVDYLVDVMEDANTIVLTIEENEVVFIKGDLAEYILDEMGIINRGSRNS